MIQSPTSKAVYRVSHVCSYCTAVALGLTVGLAIASFWLPTIGAGQIVGALTIILAVITLAADSAYRHWL
jgi:uncharacterized membrane protein